MPMEQVPVLEIDGIKYNQHKAICKYIFSKNFGAYASSLEEELVINAIIDDIDEIRCGNFEIFFYVDSRNTKYLNNFFSLQILESFTTRAIPM